MSEHTDYRLDAAGIARGVAGGLTPTMQRGRVRPAPLTETATEREANDE